MKISNGHPHETPVATLPLLLIYEEQFSVAGKKNEHLVTIVNSDSLLYESHQDKTCLRGF